MANVDDERGSRIRAYLHSLNKKVRVTPKQNGEFGVSITQTKTALKRGRKQWNRQLKQEFKRIKKISPKTTWKEFSEANIYEHHNLDVLELEWEIVYDS